MQISRGVLICDVKINQVGRKNLAVRFDRDQARRHPHHHRKSGGRVRRYSRPDNDFTRRFPLIADAPPKWLSKKCRPLSKKCKKMQAVVQKMQAKPPFSQMGAWWWPSGASVREEGNYENPRPMPWKARIGYPLPQYMEWALAASLPSGRIAPGATSRGRHRIPVDWPAAVGVRSITSDLLQIRHHRDRDRHRYKPR